jgi:tetratricopeptide (TPR) repeat protein
LDSSRIEIIIQKLLEDHDATYVADDLLKKWDRGELSENDQQIAAQFLINAGFLKTLQNQFRKHLSQDRSIVWISYLEMIVRTTEVLPDEIVDSILVGMTESNQLENLLYVQKAGKLNSRIDKLIKKFLEESNKTLNAEKKQLVEKLQRKINDRMEEEVKSLSLQLRERFPGDQEILDITSNLDLAYIRSLVQKKEREMSQSIPLKKEDPYSFEKIKIVEDVVKNAQENPNSAYDLAIMLTQIEVYNDALTCLSYAPASMERDWLKLDLLIKSENYIDAIGESFEIEKKYSENPETLFAALQSRAQALHGLGEKDKAIQILEKLLETSPRNYTAKVLLHSWRNS